MLGINFPMWFYADNDGFPVFRDVAVEAVLPAPTPDDYEEVAAVTGRVFVAATPEQFTYDANGNMTCDGRFRYTWNAENRLVRAQELCAPPSRNPYTVTYAYDHKGRMVRKRITENDGNDSLVRDTSYIWDGWNIIREIQWPVASGQWSVVTDNIWGLDLDGTLQGAGGAGALLAVVRSDCAATNSSLFTLHSSLYFPTYDANGNISEYVTTNGEIVAHYDYSPFGEALMQTGDLAATFTHRFSTKPWCPVTGLCEYQMRKYRPEIGRWLNRDPIEENSDFNILFFCRNRPLDTFDSYGLAAFIVEVAPKVAEHDIALELIKKLIEKIMSWLKSNITSQQFETAKSKNRILFDSEAFSGSFDDYLKKIEREKLSQLIETKEYKKTIDELVDMATKVTEKYDYISFCAHGYEDIVDPTKINLDLKDGKFRKQKDVLATVMQKLSKVPGNVLIVSCYQTWNGKGDKGNFREWLKIISPKFEKNVIVSKKNGKVHEICGFNFVPVKLERKIGKLKP